MKSKYIECPKCRHLITIFQKDKTISCYSCGGTFEVRIKDEKEV